MDSHEGTRGFLSEAEPDRRVGAAHEHKHSCLYRLCTQELGGGRLLVKAECLQRTGSFKYRGALHRLLRLQAEDPAAAERGVVAFSSGNFGQALAAAATSLRIQCTIVSPHDAPPLKLERYVPLLRRVE